MERCIFISYRRDDDPSFAGRLSDRLKSAFTPDHVFMDVDGIEPGADFVDVLKERLDSCAALLAIMGRNWLVASRRRLDATDDFVLKREKKMSPL